MNEQVRGYIAVMGGCVSVLGAGKEGQGRSIANRQVSVLVPSEVDPGHALTGGVPRAPALMPKA